MKNTKFKIGDAVSTNYQNKLFGIVVAVPGDDDDHSNHYHVERVDGQVGGGIVHNGKQTWLVNEYEIKLYKELNYDEFGYIQES